MSTAPPATSQRDAAQAQNALQVVAFRLGDEEYAIEITKAKEIILVDGITRVPQMPPWIEGIINLRGTVIPVIDLRQRFGLPAVGRDDHARIIVARLDGRIVGMIVDAVSRVMKIPQADIQPPPETIAGLAGAYLVGVAKLDGRMQFLLDAEKILQAGERAALPAAG